MKVRAAELVAPGRMELVERDLGRVHDGHVRIQMMQVGFCGSDADRARAADPSMERNRTGHEGFGRIVEVGRDVDGLTVGDTVAPWTRDGGQMAEYYDAPARYCVPLRSDLPHLDFPSAVEPLACVVNSARGVLEVGDDVAIVGASGFLGAMMVQLCRLGGARHIIGASRTSTGRQRVLECGATHAVDPGELEETVKDVTRGRGVDLAYEFAGHEAGVRLAGRAARAGTFERPAGTVGVAGYHQLADPPTEWGLWNGKGLRVVNCHFRPDWECVTGMERAARLLEHGDIDPGGFCSFRLDDADGALRHAIETGEKSIVVF